MPSSKSLSTAKAPRRGSSRLAFWATLVAVVAVAFVALDSIKERFYIFEPLKLHAAAKEAIELHSDNTTALIHHLVATIAKDHPSWTINQGMHDPSEWVWNNAGGAMGAMTLLHASCTEYLIIFGTPLGTEGHTGRHTADDYFHILQGEQWAAKAGALEMERYPAGSVHHLRRGDVKQYKFHEGGWALELAQGWIPPMLPFGFADTFFSTLDFPTLYHTVRITGREMLKNLAHGKI